MGDVGVTQRPANLTRAHSVWPSHPPPSSDTEKDITVLLDLLFPDKMTWATQIVMVMALGLAHQIESQRVRRSVVDDRHDRKGFDCNDSRLSPKARRMFCREVEVTSRPGRETQETSAVTPSSPLLEPRVTYSPTEKPWSKPESALTVTVPGTTTQDWLNAIPECSDLVVSVIASLQPSNLTKVDTTQTTQV